MTESVGLELTAFQKIPKCFRRQLPEWIILSWKQEYGSKGMKVTLVTLVKYITLSYPSIYCWFASHELFSCQIKIMFNPKMIVNLDFSDLS